MTIHPDIVLYLLYESIRGDWTDGVRDRKEVMIKTLPYTNFVPKEDFVRHLNRMIINWDNNPNQFDGRIWANNETFKYNKLYIHYSTLENLESTNYLIWYNDGEGKKLLSNTDVVIASYYEVMDLWDNFWSKRNEFSTK